MNRRPLRWLPLLAAVATCVLTARLGFWQLDRAAQKTQAQRLLAERSALPPVAFESLPQDARGAEALLQRRARLQGRWLAEATVALDNRPMAARVGFYIVTPLRLSDGSAVLVQRGWLPRDAQDRTRLAPYQTPSGEVTVDGRIAPRVPRLYTFDGAETGVLRQNLDIEAFARERSLALRPWVLIEVAAPGAPDDGLRRDWPAPASGIEKHHGYAVQWFALAALSAGLLVWFQFLRPTRPDHDPERPST